MTLRTRAAALVLTAWAVLSLVPVVQPVIAPPFAILGPGLALALNLPALRGALSFAVALAGGMSIGMITSAAVIYGGSWSSETALFLQVVVAISLCITSGLVTSRQWQVLPRWRPNRTALVWLLVIAVATGVGVWSLVNSSEDSIGPWGLVGVLPLAWFGCVAIVLAAACWRGVRAPGPFVWPTSIAALVLLLHGAAQLVETVSRFNVAWLHAGFVAVIDERGALLTDVDARFSWPNFFAWGAELFRISWANDPSALLPFFAVVANLAFAVPMLVILKRAGLGRTGVAVFAVVNWVGQDYFSPQAVNLFLYLVVIAVALTVFDRSVPPEMELGQRIVLLLAMTLIAAAMAGSHQLTPIIATVSLIALAVAKRLRPWPLGWVFATCAILWLSYVAEPYWSGHINDLFGNLGDISSVFNAGVSARVQGSPTRIMVVRLRMLESLLVWLLALAGFAYAWRKSRHGRALVPLAIVTAAPGVLLATQSYGGEAFLRVYLFSLVGAVPLIMMLPWRPIALWALLVPLSALFVVTRYGNETFERMSVAEQELVRPIAYPTTGTVEVVTLNSYSPGLLYERKYSDPTRFNFPATTNSIGAAPSLSQLESLQASDAEVYLLATDTMRRAGVELNGYPESWADDYVQALLDTGDYVVIARNESGVLIQPR